MFVRVRQKGEPLVSKVSKTHRIHSPLQDNVLSLTAIVSLIVLVLVSVSGVLWILVRTGVLSYDVSIFDPPTTETAAADDEDGIFDMLRPITESSDMASENDHPEIIRFSGSFSTLRSLLSDLQIPDHYQAQFETVLYSDTSAAKSAIQIYRSGNAYRINRYAPGTSNAGSPTDVYVSDGTAVVYTDNRSNTHARFPVSASFSPEALAGIPSVASFNEIPDEQILHASYTVLDGEFVYYVLYVTPTATDNRIVHEIWISADTELVMRCCTYLCRSGEDPTAVITSDENRIFSSALTHVSDLSARERERLFVLPETP